MRRSEKSLVKESFKPPTATILFSQTILGVYGLLVVFVCNGNRNQFIVIVLTNRIIQIRPIYIYKHCKPWNQILLMLFRGGHEYKSSPPGSTMTKRIQTQKVDFVMIIIFMSNILLCADNEGGKITCAI